MNPHSRFHARIECLRHARGARFYCIQLPIYVSAVARGYEPAKNTVDEYEREAVAEAVAAAHWLHLWKDR